MKLAQNAVEALMRIGLQRPGVVLLDAYMPGMDGLEACRCSRDITHAEWAAMRRIRQSISGGWGDMLFNEAASRVHALKALRLF